MFRVTFNEGEDEIGITLEGRVAGPAVAELNRAWEELAPRLNTKHLWIDLRRVTHSDAAGKQVLGTIYAETHAQLLTRTLWSEYLALEIMYGAADSVFAHACEWQSLTEMELCTMAFQDFTCRGNDEFVSHATNISETLSNLAYLIGIDAGHPERVRIYAHDAEERLRALDSLLRSTGCAQLATH